METLSDDENDPGLPDAKTINFVSPYAMDIEEYEEATFPLESTFTMYHRRF